MAAPHSPPRTPDAGTTARVPRGLLVVLVLGVVALAAAGYAWKGSPALQPVPAVAARADDTGEQDARREIEGVVSDLVQNLAERPEDANAWLMLGRSNGLLGRRDEALAAYEKAVALRGGDAGMLAEYARALATKNGGRSTPQSDALLARALAAEPANPQALGLAGISAFQHADYVTAIRHWETMARGLPADSPDLPRLQASLAEARKRSDSTATSLSGTVTLAPALARQASPSDTVFIFARAAQGSGAPLAALRKQVRDLPIRFSLDDSMAVLPDAKLSGATQLIVGARISKSGNPIRSPGDLSGESAPTVPGARGVSITIDTVIGP